MAMHLGEQCAALTLELDAGAKDKVWARVTALGVRCDVVRCVLV